MRTGRWAFGREGKEVKGWEREGWSRVMRRKAKRKLPRVQSKGDRHP
jgi:hypothetical protein